MNSSWNYENEIKKYEKLWTGGPHTGKSHTPAVWDGFTRRRRVTEAPDAERLLREKRRAARMAEFLRANGLLNNTDSVIDIGCGRGHVDVELARTVKSVTALDFSNEVIADAKKCAADAGISNINFILADFRELDIKKTGWERSFDLVFTSITPAVNLPSDIERVEALSRAFCFSNNFVYVEDDIGYRAAMAAVPQVRPVRYRDSRAFYAMINLLWLKGRLPIISYDKESHVTRRKIDDESIERNMHMLPPQYRTQQTRDRIREFYDKRADENGCVECPVERTFGRILWDVRISHYRRYDELYRLYQA